MNPFICIIQGSLPHNGSTRCKYLYIHTYYKINAIVIRNKGNIKEFLLLLYIHVYIIKSLYKCNDPMTTTTN